MNPQALESDPFQAKGLQSLSHDLSGDPFAGEDPFNGGERPIPVLSHSLIDPLSLMF